MEEKSVKEFWEEKAREHGVSHKSSWEDFHCMQMEIDTIDKYLHDGDRVLDIGCGNGLATLGFATRKEIHIKGIDYSDEMIRSAQVLFSEGRSILKGTALFSVGNALSLEEAPESYDRVLTRRVIINLNGIDDQVKALKEVHRSLVPGGYFLMSEATLSGLRRINALRGEFGLEELKQPWHNLYIDEEQVLPRLAGLFELVETVHFSSTYYIGSRVVQPFVKKQLGLKPDYASEINRLFAMLPHYGDYGIQKLFVLKKT